MTIGVHKPVRRFAGIVVMFLAAICAALASAQSTPAASLVVDPIEPRIDVVAGATLVAPVRVVGDPTKFESLSSRLDDGRKVSALLRCISVSLDPGAPATWLPPPGVWKVDKKAPGEGFGATWVLVMQLPPDAAGQSVWVGNSKLPLNWLPSPAALVRAGKSFDWPAPLDASKLTPELRDLLTPEAESPVRRWRYRLVTTGLDPRREAELRLTLGVSEFSDPVLEALARQGESRWSVAIAWLWRDRPDLAQRVAQRVARIVDFGDGHQAPAWPIDQAELDSLAADLVDPELSTQGRIARAETWLRAQEPLVAWLTDDAGLSAPDPGDESLTLSVTTASIANLSDRAATVAYGEGGAKPELSPVGPGQVATLSAAMRTASAETPRTSDSSAAFVLSSGPWSVSLSPLWSRVPVGPPGRTMAGFRPDFTLRSWRSPSSTVDGPAPAETRAMLTRGSTTLNGEMTWNVLIECRRGSRADDPTRDRVELWVGPHGHPRLVIQLTAMGEATLIQGEHPEEVRSIVDGVRILKEDSRWVAIVPLDAASIEPESIVRLGLVRIDARGVRASWPRAMLPWQLEPSRVSFSLKAWGGLGAK
jgi:hypothetical protein